MTTMIFPAIITGILWVIVELIAAITTASTINVFANVIIIVVIIMS